MMLMVELGTHLGELILRMISVILVDLGDDSVDVDGFGGEFGDSGGFVGYSSPNTQIHLNPPTQPIVKTASPAYEGSVRSDLGNAART